MSARLTDAEISALSARNKAARQTSPHISIKYDAISDAAHFFYIKPYFFTLPYPPSTNTYWRNIARGRTILSEKARAYRKSVKAAAIVSKPLETRLKVTIELSPPDKRRRDLDNVTKALFDSLQHANVYLDDSQIDEFTIKRMPVVKGGRCEVLIEEL